MLGTSIANRAAKIGVVGVGYIGLPTAAVLSQAGFTVVGMDVDHEKVAALNRGECYIDELGLPEIVSAAVKKRRLSGTTKYSDLKECDVLMFCTQTPLHSDGRPNLDVLFGAVDGVVPFAKASVLVICESTVPPGTTGRILERFTKARKYVLDKNIWAAHCPERVLPGKVVEEFRANNRIVGGVSAASTSLARKIYESFLTPEMIVDTTSRVSEFAKLAENTFRDVNISLANEFAMIADALGVDVSEVIRIANMHPRVNIHSPGIGVGGHCLPKDPLLLSSASSEHGLVPRLIPLARQLNTVMPEYTVRRLEQAVASIGLVMKGLRVLILGTSFKENVDDTRNSPSEVLVRLLIEKGAIVKAHDVHSRERFGADATDVAPGIEWADVLVLAVPHREYLSLLPGLDLSSKVLVDGRNAFKPGQLAARVYVGIGRPIGKG